MKSQKNNFIIISFCILLSIAGLYFGENIFVKGLNILPGSQSNPNQTPDEFYVGKITDLQEETTPHPVTGEENIVQHVQADLENDPTQAQVTMEHGGAIPIADYQKVNPGEKIVVTKTFGGPEGAVHYIYDRYRLSAVIVMALVFCLFAVVFGKKRGFFAIIGLIFSILVLTKFIIPQILAGHSPLLISVIGGMMITLVSLYLSHGFNKKTTISLVSTLITLAIAAGLSVLFVSLTKLTGVGTEEAFYLQLDVTTLNAKGLLLGGIIIGVLGVLDDVTTTQAATVDEILKANPRLSVAELYERGITVGKEHIASLVNTLALAYAGASFPLLLLFTIDKDVPLWVNINSEYIVEEIVRTLVGSTALLFAVPITTLMAAIWLKQGKKMGVHHR